MLSTQSLALLTDLYQLTMAYGYWKGGVGDTESVFHLTFRKNPFGSGFSIACGLQDAIGYLENFRFHDDDIQYLSTLHGNDEKPLFERGFLDYLAELRLECDIDAIPEGTVVFPHEPLMRVQGKMLQCQLVETALLNIINFQTLISTKAARVCYAARGDQVWSSALAAPKAPMERSAPRARLTSAAVRRHPMSWRASTSVFP
jgi:nicotinate phosphoribosyltransferase